AQASKQGLWVPDHLEHGNGPPPHPSVCSEERKLIQVVAGEEEQSVNRTTEEEEEERLPHPSTALKKDTASHKIRRPVYAHATALPLSTSGHSDPAAVHPSVAGLSASCWRTCKPTPTWRSWTWRSSAPAMLSAAPISMTWVGK